jgi:hypothetical protein
MLALIAQKAEPCTQLIYLSLCVFWVLGYGASTKLFADSERTVPGISMLNLSDCTSQSLRPAQGPTACDANRGAVWFGGTSTTAVSSFDLWITRCTFFNCMGDRGVAIYGHGQHLGDSAATSCLACDLGAFAYLRSATGKRTTLQRSSSFSSRCKIGTVYFDTSNYSRPTVVASSYNCSFSVASDHGSCVSVDPVASLSLDCCRLESNGTSMC